MMRRIWPLFFSLVALVAPAMAGTDEVRGPAMVKSVRQEFGGIRYDYLGRHRRVKDQIIMDLGNPNPTKHMADGNYLISGCRPHSCDEKSSVIVTAKGKMLAAGMIYLSCSEEQEKRKPIVECDLRRHLKIFMKQKNNQPAFVQELKDWAAREGYSGAAETQILR